MSDALIDVVKGETGFSDCRTFRVTPTPWGYTIFDRARPITFAVVVQAVSAFAGCVLIAAALSLLALPDLVNGSADAMIRYCAAAVMAGTGATFVNYAGRGIRPEVQIDPTLGEMRFVVRNRTGVATLLGRFGFDAVDHFDIVEVDRLEYDAELQVKLRDDDRPMVIAAGSIRSLWALRKRLENDGLVAAHLRAAEPASLMHHVSAPA